MQFKGITDVEVESLLDNLSTETESFSGLSDSEIEKLARDAAREILGDIEFE